MNTYTLLTIAGPYALIAVALVSLAGNGTILLTVAKNPALRQKDCLYLIAALAVADFITAAGTIPYAANMLANNYSNCTAGALIWSVAGNVSGVRMNQLCTLFLAIDRLYALFRPFAYRAKNHLKVAQIVIVISLLWGIFDIAINAIGSDFDEVKTTCTAGATYGNVYKIYRMITNFILNTGTQIIYLGVFYKLRHMRSDQTTKEAKYRFEQANASLFWLFLMSLLLMTLPSILSVYNFISQSTFSKTVSPVLQIFPVLNGAFNVFIYAWKHKDFNAAIKGLFRNKSTATVSVTGPTVQFIGLSPNNRAWSSTKIV